jgi:hypothetical protein
MQLPPTSCLFISPRSKYSPQHAVLKHPQRITATNCKYWLCVSTVWWLKVQNVHNIRRMFSSRYIRPTFCSNHVTFTEYLTQFVHITCIAFGLVSDRSSLRTRF